MTLNPNDPMFEGALRNIIREELNESRLAVLVRQLQAATVPRAYTTTTKPSSPETGQIIFVSNGGAGAVFQGWNGSAWVNLG